MKKNVWLIGIVFLFVSFGYSLAQERLDEMVEIIEERLEEGEERNTFLETIEEYIEVRDEALSLLAGLVAETDADEFAEEWDDLVEQMQNLPILNDLDDELSSEAALALYTQFVDEERAWFLNLGERNPVAYRDQIVALRIRLANMTELLEEKWEGLLNEDGQLDQKELEVMADINEIVTKLVAEIDTSRQKMRDNVQLVAEVAASEAASSVLSLAGPVGDALGMIAQATKQYNEYKTALENLKPQLKDLVGKELGLLVNFNQTRKDTQLFVEQNNFDKMKALYSEAEDKIESFADVGTDGQGSDAEDFVELILGHLSKHVSEGETIYKDFVTKHNLKFFGPISADIKESLTESQVWLAEAEEVRNLDIQELLSSLRDDTNVFFGVNLSVDGISPEEREYIESQLRNDMNALKKAIEDNYLVFSNDNLSLLYDRRSLAEAIQ
jgi:hypothetical protein